MTSALAPLAAPAAPKHAPLPPAPLADSHHPPPSPRRRRPSPESLSPSSRRRSSHERSWTPTSSLSWSWRQLQLRNQEPWPLRFGSFWDRRWCCCRSWHKSMSLLLELGLASERAQQCSAFQHCCCLTEVSRHGYQQQRCEPPQTLPSHLRPWRSSFSSRRCFFLRAPTPCFSWPTEPSSGRDPFSSRRPGAAVPSALGSEKRASPPCA
mmetsp:Transcript_18853/g.40482  ORF Transcript_18853/g.40482 Transcript_18853/m.40482 type:complete len:209 (+) Transcript_18853:1151-1777(+)